MNATEGAQDVRTALRNAISDYGAARAGGHSRNAVGALLECCRLIDSIELAPSGAEPPDAWRAAVLAQYAAAGVSLLDFSEIDPAGSVRRLVEGAARSQVLGHDPSPA